MGAVTAFERDEDTGELEQLSGNDGEDGCVSETGVAPPLFPSETCEDGKGLDNATDVTVSPDGEKVYVASQVSGGGAVAVFARDENTGKLTQLSGDDRCVSDTGAAGSGSPNQTCTNGTELRGASSVRVSPDGENVYVATRFSDAVAVFDRDGEGKQVDTPARY